MEAVSITHTHQGHPVTLLTSARSLVLLGLDHLQPLNELSDPQRGARQARHGAGDVDQLGELEHEVHADKPSL